MAQQLVCDLCGRPIGEDEERRFFKIKELKHFFDLDSIFTSWVEIDAHKSCVDSLLSARVCRVIPPTGGSSMQDN